MWSRQPTVMRAELYISFRTSGQRKQKGPWLSLRTGRNWFNNRNLLCATCWAWHLELRDKQDEVPALPGLIAFWGNRQAHRPAHQGLVPCAKGAQRSPLNPGALFRELFQRGSHVSGQCPSVTLQRQHFPSRLLIVSQEADSSRS